MLTTTALKPARDQPRRLEGPAHAKRQGGQTCVARDTVGEHRPWIVFRPGAVRCVLLDRVTAAGGSFAGQPGVLELALPADPTSAAAARQSLAAYCRDHGAPSELTADALLVISELVANAVLHARSPTIAWAEYEAGAITVAVV